MSVGAVIFDKNFEKVLCHHVAEVGHVKNIYLLMRESIEPGETFETALHRGVLEEFGAKVEIVDFLGSLEATDKWFGEIDNVVDVQKTTIYFLSKIISQDDSMRIDDGTAESKSTLVWLDLNELAKKMNKQFKEYGINNLNEEIILKRVKKYLDIHKPTLV